MKHVIHYDANEVQVHSYANLVLLQRLYAQLEQRRWVKERKKFLQAEIKKNDGKLICGYCHNDKLKIKSQKRHEQATVDHIVPKSKGGSPWDHDNFVVCCNSCNKKKASGDAEDFMCSKYIARKKQSLSTL